jgi:hypothetical protein
VGRRGEIRRWTTWAAALLLLPPRPTGGPVAVVCAGAGKADLTRAWLGSTWPTTASLPLLPPPLPPLPRQGGGSSSSSSSSSSDRLRTARPPPPPPPRRRRRRRRPSRRGPRRLTSAPRLPLQGSRSRCPCPWAARPRPLRGVGSRCTCRATSGPSSTSGACQTPLHLLNGWARAWGVVMGEIGHASVLALRLRVSTTHSP